MHHQDRVLCGELDEALVAAQGGGQAEKGRVAAGIMFVAMVESPVAGQPGGGPLDDPSAAAQSFAGLDALAGDAHADAPAAQPSAQVRDAVGCVGLQALGLEMTAAVGSCLVW